MNDLIKLLKKKQADNGLTDGEFAGVYNISGPEWSNFKSGKRELTKPFLGMVLRQHRNDNEVRTAVLNYIEDLVTEDRQKRMKEGLRD